MQTGSEVSDYRNEDMNSQPISNIQTSYSRAVNNQPMNFPTKHQAIIFNSIEGVKIQDYVIALGNKIGPKNITFASRISHNRICIYLANKNLVDKFINEHRNIEINNETIEARKLIAPSERLIISNVCPSIPHTILENELKRNGIKPLSSISFLRIGITDPEYAHIQSFRRQVYITPNTNIPESVVLDHDDTSYRVFLSKDGLSCHKCKKQGHLAANCISNPEHTSSNTQSTERFPLLQENKKPDAPEPDPLEETASGSKRTIDHILSPPITTTGESSTNPPNFFIKPKEAYQKKQKRTAQNIEKLMHPAKDFIDKGSFVLSYEEITDFLDNVYGSPDPLSCARQYTDDIPAVADMLTKIHPYLTERKIKTRATKIRNKLINQLKGKAPSSEFESDSSQE